MMVVLTAWERDANLLRPKRSQGTLRLLFLDEANRLSQDNLGVLFDLCQNLDLQLIIAAPEVTRERRAIPHIGSFGTLMNMATKKLLSPADGLRQEDRCMWDRIEHRLALMELVVTGRLRRRRVKIEPGNGWQNCPGHDSRVAEAN